MEAGVLQQLAQKFERRALIAVFLQQNVEHLAVVVDRTPQLRTLATDLDHHLAQMPARGRRRTSAPQVGCESLAELARPASDRLVADFDPALGEQLFDIAQT